MSKCKGDTLGDVLTLGPVLPIGRQAPGQTISPGSCHLDANHILSEPTVAPAIQAFNYSL